ncbi:Zn(II)2Cys6 transcription factor [Aspergillus steynii IBT 23096]|uniref:Zn(II)2Cys6 transcription factor n=1 Tax=Aspergillus steynii IBT 23096 TaxID=1392250 RepID=A0A2I2FUM1_9EURO|nr:Zn(II)2Cys6 transcription factor [Aspergillus steynii IBT 23096]PLB44345.1 Zn(II)2Cys6 transcription factor [Aspergillus steynii IBT 23096]
MILSPSWRYRLLPSPFSLPPSSLLTFPADSIPSQASPPKARGSGRSGPRRRTGCLTCRARKVRCDEVKPNCANCVRLRLQCSYKNIVPGLVPRHNARVQKQGRTAVSPAPDRPDLNFFDTVLRPDERCRRSSHAHLTEHGQQEPLEGPMRSISTDFHGAFDILGFIGEINSDLEQKHLDLENGLSDFPLVDDVPSPAQTKSRLVEDVPTVDSGYSDAVQNDAPVDMSTWPETKSTYEEQLLTDFLQSEAPPAIFGSVDLEWSYVRGVIVALSTECSALLNSIYCYSDVRKAMREGKRWRMAPTFHQQANSKIQSYLQGAVNSSKLKRIFTAVFLLMMTELMSTPELCRPETSYLHSAYLLLQQFHDQTKPWTGFGHLIVSWVSLLDVKALIAGREGDPLFDLGTLSSTTSNNRKPSPPNDDQEESPLFSQPAYLVQNSIIAPAFHFFAQTQQVIRRIVSIDLHHRSRGTVSDEFEVLQIAHQVNADLEYLWNTRPRVLDIYNHPETHLFATLRSDVASQICRVFRQYVANFLAIFIYLHRVAFVIYPRTDRVHRAVDQIIQLATVEAASASHHTLSSSFLWPLFVAGLEGSHEQRAWIMDAMHRMADDTISSQRHPNASRALLLLEEMTRRQDTSRTWADSRCVRREMFTDFFVMI